MRVDIETLVSYLARFPYAGRATDEADLRVLTIPKHPYLVFYKVYAEKDVIILRVLHGARQRD